MNTLVALLTLVGLAACELQPAPPKQEPPPAPTPPAAAPVEGSGSAGSAAPAPTPAPPPVAAAADAGVADAGPPKLVISAPCMEIGAKFAQLMIDAAKDDQAQRMVREQERANMTRKTGEACTKQNWGEDARKCYLAAKTPEAFHACDSKLPPQPQQVKQPKQPVAPVPGVGPAGTDMKTEQPKPPRQPKH